MADDYLFTGTGSMTSLCAMDSAHRGRCVLFVAALLFANCYAHCSNVAAKEPSEEPVLEHLWTYRRTDGLDPPDTGTIFCVIANPEQPGARTLTVGTESILSSAKIDSLLRGRIAGTEGAVLHQGPAPAREISFNRLDLDGDSIDEVLLTGRGGAGGTSLLSVYRVGEKRVTCIFSDSSRYGFYLFDADGDGTYEIANPGFESIKGPNAELQEKAFQLYELRGGVFKESHRLAADAFELVIANLEATKGAPIPTTSQVGILQVFKGKRQPVRSR